MQTPFPTSKYHLVAYTSAIIVILAGFALYFNLSFASDTARIRANQQYLSTQYSLFKNSGKLLDDLLEVVMAGRNYSDPQNALEQLYISTDRQRLTFALHDENPEAATIEKIDAANSKPKKIKSLLHEIVKFGSDYDLKIRNIIKAGRDASISRQSYTNMLKESARYKKKIEPFLDKHFSSVSTLLESRGRAQRSMRRLVNILLLIGTFAALYYLGRSLIAIRHVESDLESDYTKSKQILDSTNVGFFLMGRSLMIDSEYSRVLGVIFGMKNLAGKQFPAILNNLATKSVMKKSLNYFRLLCSKNATQKLIHDTNPLTCVKIHLKTRNGGSTEKYIQCEFTRIVRNGALRKILCTVQDISKSVKIQNMLKETSRRSEQQVTTITSLLQFEQDLIEDFIHTSARSLVNIRTLLVKPSRTRAEQANKLDEIFRIIHQIKGDAAVLDLKFLTKSSHIFENTLERLRKKNNLSNADFSLLVDPLKMMIQNLNSIRDLMEQITEGEWSQEANENNESIVARLTKLAQRIAGENGKQVYVVNDGLTDNNIPQKLKKGIDDVLVQLTRNAIVHGIEDKKTRVAQDKTPYGCIHISLRKTPGMFTLSVRDDGAGLSIPKIKQAAIASGRYPREAVNKWTEKHALKAILQPGFSTASHLDENAGRGVGLDIIKATVERWGGSLSISSKKGQYTEFSMRFKR